VVALSRLSCVLAATCALVVAASLAGAARAVGGVTNVALATPNDGFELDGDRVAFAVDEASQGSDLNGDGDSSDFVLHVFNAARGTTTNVGLDAGGGSVPRLDGRRVAFLVGETSQGDSDLNGDGDSLDVVLHVFDAGSRTTTNVGLAGGSSLVVFEDSRVVFLVSEADQGSTDRNGDGDVSDLVLHVFDASRGESTNTGLATVEPVFEFDGTRVAVAIDEAAQGTSDLNGDGDASDSVLHVFDAARDSTANVGLATNSGLSGGAQLDATRVAVAVEEAAQGASDLNDDGDASDLVLQVFDAARGTTANVELAGSPGLIFFDLDGERVALGVDEASQGSSDLNGDGDASDSVLHVFDAARGTTTNVGLAEGGHQLEGDRVAFGVLEAAQGSSDLNGDGDADDLLLHVFDAARGTTTNVGLHSAALPEVDDEWVAIGVEEFSQGGSDLNGDGDAGDFVLHMFNAARGTTTNVGLATVFAFHLEETRVAFLIFEGNQASSDLNGDGDADDLVLHVFDAARGTTTNVGLASLSLIEFDGRRAALNVDEFSQGGTDLNGDGDASDSVLHVFGP
jgi:hypothetical protein